DCPDCTHDATARPPAHVPTNPIAPPPSALQPHRQLNKPASVTYRPPMHTGLCMYPRDWFIAVYMMTNRKHGTLYIGVSGALLKRVSEHREGLLEGFTKK